MSSHPIVVLKADSGKYAARCNNCIPGAEYPDSVMVHEADPTQPWAQWRLQRQPDGHYTFQSVDSGKYMARCNNCIPGASYPDSVMVHESDPDQPWAHWQIESLGNGKVALRSADSGKYAARCNNCIPDASYPDSVMVHESDPNQPWAQWELYPV